MRAKHGKSETTSDSELEANGDARLSITNDNNEMKKDKENENIEPSRRSAGKKRTSRSRHSLRETIKELTGKSDAEDTQAAEPEEENKSVGRPGPSKRFRKDEKATTIEKEYEVQKIVGQRTIKGRRQFLIRWKGYDEDSDTWEQEKDLNCTELIEEYLAENAESEEDTKPKRMENSAKSPGKSKSPKLDRKTKKAMKPIVKKQAENGKQITAMDEEKDDKDNQKEFEVEKILEVHFKKNKTREFLIRWKGFTSADDTWEPEKNLNCPELIAKFMQKVEKAKNTEARELRTNRPHTKRYTLSSPDQGRRLSRRNMDKQRATYHECDE